MTAPRGDFRRPVTASPAGDRAREQTTAAALLAGVHSGWCGAHPSWRADHPDALCHCRLQGVEESIAAALAEARAEGAREQADTLDAVRALADAGVANAREWGELGSPYSNGAAKAFARLHALLPPTHTTTSQEGE